MEIEDGWDYYTGISSKWVNNILLGDLYMRKLPGKCLLRLLTLDWKLHHVTCSIDALELLHGKATNINILVHAWDLFFSRDCFVEYPRENLRRVFSGGWYSIHDNAFPHSSICSYAQEIKKVRFPTCSIYKKITGSKERFCLSKDFQRKWMLICSAGPN